MTPPGEPDRTRGVAARIREKVNTHLRRTFIAGALLLIPVALTYLILVFIYDVVNGVLLPGVEWVAERFGRREWTFPGMGVVAAVLLLYIAGIVVARRLGVRLVRWGQETAIRLPFVGPVYSASRQLIESFSGAKMTGFNRVVMIQYPRRGYWAIGFLTSMTTNAEGEALAVVYIPTAPLPNSGWLSLVRCEEVYDTNLSPREAMQFVFSGGIVCPETIRTAKIPEAGGTPVSPSEIT